MVLLIGSRAADAALLFGPHAKIAEVATGRVRVSGAINVEAGIGAIRDAFGDAVEIQVDKSALPAVAAPVEAEDAPAAEASVEAPAGVSSEGPEVPVSVRVYGANPREQVDTGREIQLSIAGLVSFAEPPTAWDGEVWTIRGTTTRADEVKARLKAANVAHVVVVYLDGKLAVGRLPRG